ncbi:Metallophosphoesterase mpped2 [Linnemannia zychae]|nr:Metallophosphoesterase mpped2 [Linnemannia zychae]
MNYPKPKPPPQNFRNARRGKMEEPPKQPMEDIWEFPPHVYVAPLAPAKKPAPNWLRMVCVSDTHNTTDANNFTVPEADILVHAGDFTKMGTTAQIDQFVCWLKSMSHIPVKVVVAGNHDVILDKNFYERSWNRFHTVKEDHEAALNKLKTAGHGIVYLDNESYVVDGAKILHKKHQKQQKKNSIMTTEDNSPETDDIDVEVSEEVDPREGWVEGYRVWGSPWQPEFWDWAFNGVRGELKDIWKHIPENTDVLITHGPPKGHGDIIPEDKRVNVGCEELLERLEAVKPMYHVFGHIHRGYGVTEIEWGEGFHPTRCINASTCTESYRPLNHPIIVDLPPK